MTTITKQYLTESQRQDGIALYDIFSSFLGGMVDNRKEPDLLTGPPGNGNQLPLDQGLFLTLTIYV